MEVMPDHVHLLIEVDPQFGIHKAVKLIKGTTSRVLRQGVSLAAVKDSVIMDELVFCFNGWWRTFVCN